MGRFGLYNLLVEQRTVEASDALAMIERNESHFWDLKSAKSRGTVIQKIAVALANAEGGEFAVGIEDAATGGQPLDRWQGYEKVEDANYVLEALARDVTPPVPYALEFVRIAGRESQGLVCYVIIRKSESVHRMADGRVFVRRNAASVELAGQSILDLSLSKGARSYEDQLLADYTWEDLAVEAELLYFLGTYSPSTQGVDFVWKQRLVDRNTGQAKVAAAVLYAEVPRAVMPKRCGVKIARYETKEEQPQREHLASTPLTVEGAARKLIERTLSEVSAMINKVSSMRPDGSFAPLNYPPDALKEIIVNAVIHRDYNISDDILVYVFDNRVEVKSPGLLPGHMSLDDLGRDRFARNPTLVQMLNRYPDPLNKDMGDGIQTVRRSMAAAQLQPPKFYLDGNYFVARLGHTPLARPQEIVMEYLSTHREISNGVARSLTGINSENAMKEVFYSLRNTGKIERVPGRGGNLSAWQVVKDAPDEIDSSGEH